MTTPEICMWAATAMNIAGLVTSVWHMRTRAKHGKRLAAISKDLFSMVEDEMQKRVELIKEIMQLRDAAAFEARVAAKLATVPLLGCNSNCPWNKMDPQNSFGCIHEYERRFCRLRNARIAVEEEMDG